MLLHSRKHWTAVLCKQVIIKSYHRYILWDTYSLRLKNKYCVACIKIRSEKQCRILIQALLTKFPQPRVSRLFSEADRDIVLLMKYDSILFKCFLISQ